MERFCNGLSAAFPKLQKLSMVVNPSVPLEKTLPGQVVVCAPSRRCRLVEAVEGPLVSTPHWKYWLQRFRESLGNTRGQDHAIPVRIQAFEVCARRQGRIQWKRYPL
jgi:hypothetical protein